MEWKVPYIIYRVQSDGALSEVFHAPDLKMARYWLTYIGSFGDALYRSPVHPKHSKADKLPEYQSHKNGSGAIVSEAGAWLELAKAKGFNCVFPTEQLGEADK